MVHRRISCDPLHSVCELIFRTAAVLALALGVRTTAGAQSAPDTRPPLLGGSITVAAIGELPATASVLSILDTAVAEIIADRTDAGGLTLAAPPRIGAHGSSWTQTLYRVDDIDITDPGGSGAPLLFPGIAAWDQTTVWTGAIPIDANAPGLVVSLAPRRPFDVWRGMLQTSVSPAALNATPHRTLPLTSARLNTWMDGTLVAGGPLVSNRLGTFVTATAAQSSYYERTTPQAFEARLASAFVSLLTTPSVGRQVRGMVWADAAKRPLTTAAALALPAAAERDSAVHAQVAWEHANSAATMLRAFAGYTDRRRATDGQSLPFVVIERLRDGPVPSLLDPGPGGDHVWQFGGRFARTLHRPARTPHELTGGLGLAGSSMTMQPAFSGRVGEVVNGLPARIWDFTVPATPSSWRQRTLTAYTSDVLPITDRVTLDAGLRFDAIRGEARHAPAGTGISWNDWLPRAGVHARLTEFWQIGALAEYARYGHRLPLRALGYGDPTAPFGRVYRWTGTATEQPTVLGPVVQRVGPGTGGDPFFSGIDPGLRRPHMDEIVLGFESHPRPNAFARLVAIARREQPLIGVIDVGVPASTYTTLQVRDPGIDLAGTGDDQLLTFYDRAPATFAQDRYLLTNPPDDVATFVGIEASARVSANRLFVLFGATAGRSEGLAANRGYGPLENDAASLGDVFIDPNSRAYAQGRLFSERGYTLKTALTYTWPHEFTMAMIGRYQDGQHFARLVVQDGFNQGAEAVRAFRNGRTRFTYAMTVDARLQKRFGVGRGSVTAIVDAYNVLNQALEAEEFQVTGGGPRQNLAVQVPRVVHVGLAVAFQ